MMRLTQILPLCAALFCAPLAAAAAGGGALTAGAAWSNTRGAIMSLGLEGRNIRDSGLDVDLEWREGHGGEEARLRLRWSHALGDTAFGAQTRLSLSAQHNRSDWQNDGYATSRSRLGLGLSAALAPEVGWRIGLFWQENALDHLAEGVSPLIAAEAGHSDAAGLEMGLRFGHIDSAALPSAGAQLDLSLTSALAGERRFRAFEASGVAARDFGAHWALSLRLGAGTTEGRRGRKVAIHDRAFLGGRAPRGFAPGGLGPRDYLAGQSDNALGGRNYLQASVELRHDFEAPFSLGLFWDAGAVWRLDGSPKGLSGEIDAARHLRSAAGLAFYWKSGLGIVNANIAAPLRHRESDSLGRFSLNLMSSF